MGPTSEEKVDAMDYELSLYPINLTLCSDITRKRSELTMGINGGVNRQCSEIHKNKQEGVCG